MTNVSPLPPPTFNLSGQNLTLSYAGQTASAPVSNTANGQSVTAFVEDDSDDSTGLSFDATDSGKVSLTGAVGNPGTDTLTTVQSDATKGTVVTQTEFDVLTGDITTVKIKPDGHGGYTITRTDDNQNGISAYSSNGQSTTGQYANAASLIKQLFA